MSRRKRRFSKALSAEKKSAYCGVRWDGLVWSAFLYERHPGVPTKLHNLGHYATDEDAARAFDDKVRQAYGDDSPLLNFKLGDVDEREKNTTARGN